jgi:hypothetical protein
MASSSWLFIKVHQTVSDLNMTAKMKATTGTMLKIADDEVAEAYFRPMQYKLIVPAILIHQNGNSLISVSATRTENNLLRPKRMLKSPTYP